MIRIGCRLDLSLCQLRARNHPVHINVLHTGVDDRLGLFDRALKIAAVNRIDCQIHSRQTVVRNFDGSPAFFEGFGRIVQQHVRDRKIAVPRIVEWELLDQGFVLVNSFARLALGKIVPAASAIFFTIGHTVDPCHRELIILLSLFAFSDVGIYGGQPRIGAAHVSINLNGAIVVRN